LSRGFFSIGLLFSEVSKVIFGLYSLGAMRPDN
jgi:hypothetical protein